MHVVGTAGHVDHGKSTLIKALTGIDPDRLREEKERGMTIDLGFAWLPLPSGEEVSIVDVPGHERFIKNMLAGVGGIDLALVVVAADEGIMPQTREHLDILDLLQVKRGIAVLTKADLVEPDFLELVREEVNETLSATSLKGAPVMAVSAYTGQGLPELTALLDAMLRETPQRPDRGRPRLPIDRAFTISGFGTVVTGTLIDGSLSLGQEMEIVPGGKRARVRGLQSHRKKEERIGPGTRTAVNLSGVDADEVQRGQVLTTPGWLKTTTAADVRLRMVADAPQPLRHNLHVTFHWLAAESLARVRLLDADTLEAGQEGWAQVVLETPLPLVKGDFFVVRSTVGTLGGGEIVETFAKRHRRNDPRLLDRLEALAGGDAREVALRTLEAGGPVLLRDLARKAALPEAQAREVARALVEDGQAVAFGEGGATLLYARGGWESLKEQARTMLAAHHRQYKLRKGASREELRSRLRVPADVFPAVVARLQEEGMLAEEGTLVRLPDHRPQLSDQARREADAYLKSLRAQPYMPPTDVKIDTEVLGYLTEEGQVVPVGEGIVFTADAYQEMVDRIVEHIRQNGSVTVAQVRDLFGASRKYVLPLLQSMDDRHITRRVGDDRVLV
jgi:selenocysteine-specific elongation factor